MLVVKAAKGSFRSSWWLLLAPPSILSPQELAFSCEGVRGEHLAVGGSLVMRYWVWCDALGFLVQLSCGDGRAGGDSVDVR